MNSSTDEVPFLVEHLVTEKAILQFFAEGGVGKSTVSRCAAVAMSAGLPVFGRFNCVRPLKVYYLVTEGDCREAVVHLKRMYPVLPFAEKNLFVCDKFAGTVNVIDDGQAISLMAAIEEDCPKPDIIVLDPIYPLVIGGLSEDRASSAFARFIIRLRNRFQCAVWLNHHVTRDSLTSKGEAANRSNKYYGSVWLFNALTGQYSIEKVDGGVFMHCKKDRFSLLEQTISLLYQADHETLTAKEDDQHSKRERIRAFFARAAASGVRFTFADLERAVGPVTRNEFQRVRRWSETDAKGSGRVKRVSADGEEGCYVIEVKK